MAPLLISLLCLFVLVKLFVSYMLVVLFLMSFLIELCLFRSMGPRFAREVLLALGDADVPDVENGLRLRMRPHLGTCVLTYLLTFKQAEMGG